MLKLQRVTNIAIYCHLLDLGMDLKVRASRFPTVTASAMQGQGSQLQGLLDPAD